MQYYFSTKGGVKEKLFSRLSTYYCRYLTIDAFHTNKLKQILYYIIYIVYCIG